MLKYCLLSSSAFAAIFSAAPVFAQNLPSSDDQEITAADPMLRNDIVVSATGVAEVPDKIGQAVTVIDRKTIEQRQTVAISDLLATTPGVTVTRNGGLGTLTTVRIRGAEGEQTLTLIDGVRVNDPSSPGGGFDFANLLSGSVERVEVLRGPNSVPWGSQAIGGVVNVVTAALTEGFKTRANAEYGSFDSVFANVGVSGKAGRFSGSVNAGYLRTDGISAAAAGTEPDGYRQYGGTARIGVDITDAISLDLRGYYANSRVDIDGFGFTPPYLPVDDAEYAKTSEVYGYAGLNVRLGQFRNRIAFTIADINRDNYDPAFGSAPSFFARGRSERYEYQGDWQASDAIRLVAGAQRENTRFNDGSVFKSRGTTSVYGEAILTPFDRLTLTGGVRYDDDSAFGGHTTFGANAVYALPTGTTLRGSYAEGFKAPTLYQLFGPFGLGNPNLQPETARSYDVGIEQSLVGKAITISATWFHRDTRNQIDYNAATFTYGNIARTRGQGLEVGLNMRPSDRLTVSGSYSFIDSVNRSPGANFGKQLARRPRQSVSASVDWTTPFKLAVGATVLAVGDSFDDAGNFNRLDGYVMTDVRAELPIGKRFAIYGRVDNLFDEKYTVVRGYGTPGRAAYGGVRVKFY
ncbi:MAG: TonB-dependent receptor [Sphingomonas sp.]|uniref:TonB-dependent receptor plug domain-containing protein n=1 Tax=Sphingomonas sp. TaxID=28214 RepID=UPI001ACB849C|nr:TonB-dependent receptor [Sphingomonas sp.]MBN8815514.1 TonB-dependent receptor [Sphingomonas sp.]